MSDPSGTPNLTIQLPPTPTPPTYSPHENPNVWNVPGADANGSPGQPLVGSDNWCWAKIQNTGTATAMNTTVQFFYCDPNAAVSQWSDFVTNSAGQSAPIDLAPSTTPTSVVSTTPWRPSGAGHICLIAYVEASNDAGPPQTPTTAPQLTDRHVAQDNMVAVTVAPGATLVHEFLAHSDEGAMLTVRMDDPASWSKAGVEADASAGTYQPVHFGMVDPRAATAGEVPLAVTRMEVQGSRILALRVQAPEDARPGQHALFRIESTRGGQTLSGLSVLATVAASGSDDTPPES